MFSFRMFYKTPVPKINIVSKTLFGADFLSNPARSGSSSCSYVVDDDSNER